MSAGEAAGHGARRAILRWGAGEAQRRIVLRWPAGKPAGAAAAAVSAEDGR
ncbi:MAG: hypothetical protein ACJ8EB_11430 [Allosphingosinicella sp.]